MKKIKIKYLIYSLFFAIFMSCDNVNNEVLNSESKQIESEKLLDHFSEINRIKEATIGSIYSLSNNKLSRDEIETNIIKTINKGSKTVNYSFLIKNNGFLNKGTAEDLNIEDLNLPEETVFYLNKLKNLNEKQDYQSIIVLMEEFKEDYSENPANLVSLIGVFSVLEIYKDEMVSTVKNRGCSLSGNAVGGAAISGAISGAIWGAKLGSWLGPVGIVWGLLVELLQVQLCHQLFL